jgi:curved DNA-binding protein CbpA
MTDDYYELLGVEPEATTDEIRDKYRARRGELAEKSGEAARDEMAQLNRAWNVISDPYQRGRYDAQRESVTDTNGIDDVEVVDEEPAPTAPRKRGLFAPPPERGGIKPAAPTITLPSGMQLAPTRPRLTAMAIDLFVVAVIFFGGVYGAGAAYINHTYPAKVHQLNSLRDQRDAATTKENDLSKTAKTAKDRVTTLQDSHASAAQIAAANTAAKTAQTKVDAQTKVVDDLTSRYNSIQSDLAPTQLFIVELSMLVGALYLIVPSARTGQTLGKRLQHVKVVRVDGSPLGWSGAFARYGLLVIATDVLSFLLAQLAGVIVIIAIIGWVRNPRRQGMHDRIAKTVVVDTSAAET